MVANKKKKISELFNFLPKSKIKAGEGMENGKYPFYTCSNELTKYYDEYTFEPNKLIFGTGGSASLHYASEPFATSTDCYVIEAKELNVDVKYVYYYLKNNFQILEDGFKGAGLKHISKDYLSNIMIEYPDIEEQQRIVKILDKAQEIRTKKKLANEKLDEFLKSTFIDMFGDPANNPKNWQLKTLEDFVIKEKYSIKRGPFGGSLKKEIFVPSGYLVYEQTHAIHNNYDFARYFITQSKYKELEMFKVVPGDLIISCSGVTLGKVSEIPANAKPGIINQALLKVSLDRSLINNNYFMALFREKSIQNTIFGISRGSGIPNMPSVSELKKIKFPLPPIDLQNQFAQIVQKVEAQKEKNQEIIEQMNNLFNSLMQQAFNK